ncbi:odorant receptor 82a-like [Diachasmimorpha longicaudata]|uniref:odorant receptor 82a-like n=1 Tax=Diachasmimorpha longicaudata TaxID=58733 RepID=UPI0030B8FF02
MGVKRVKSTTKREYETVPDFAELFRVCGLALRFTGIFAIDSVLTKSDNKLPDLKMVFYIFGLAPVIFEAICEARTVIKYWDTDIYMALEICTPTMSTSICVTQGFCMYYFRKDLLQLISSTRDLWDQQIVHEIDDKLIRKVKKSQFITEIYAILMILLATSFTLRPVVFLLMHVTLKRNETFDFNQLAYPSTYPFATDTMTRYILCFVLDVWIIFNAGSWWVGSDMIFLQSATHLSVQYQILQHDLMMIKPGDNSSASIQQVNAIGKRHAHLLSLVKQLKRLFSPLLWGMMVTTSIHMCIGVLSVHRELNNRNYAKIGNNTVHTIITMIQPSIYCLYANDLIDRADETSMAAYECNWVDESQGLKKALYLMSLRSQNGLKFRIYGSFNLDLNQLTQILIAAAKFLTMLINLSESV